MVVGLFEYYVSQARKREGLPGKPMPAAIDRRAT